jgi:eukaryotic-like serine/threonine-protein kinase
VDQHRALGLVWSKSSGLDLCVADAMGLMEAAHRRWLHVQVFRAKCASGTLEGSEVAIKLVNSTEDAALRHILRGSVAHEWLVHERLGVHPNLMTMHDRLVIDRAEGERPTLALVMPLLGAGDLDSLGQAARSQSRPPLDISGVLKLLCHLVWGLCHMHARGFVHGDLKPANILLAGVPGDLQAVIADFGTTSQEGTQRHVPGTTAYNPPEVCSAYTGQHSPLLYLMLHCFAAALIAACTVPPTEPT